MKVGDTVYFMRIDRIHKVIVSELHKNKKLLYVDEKGLLKYESMTWLLPKSELFTSVDALIEKLLADYRVEYETN